MRFQKIVGAVGYLERVRREAKVLGRLSHPNIVGILDFRQDEERCYIVSEFVDGGSLKSKFAPHHQEGLELVLLQCILRQAGLSFEEFLAVLRD